MSAFPQKLPFGFQVADHRCEKGLKKRQLKASERNSDQSTNSGGFHTFLRAEPPHRALGLGTCEKLQLRPSLDQRKSILKRV